MFAPFSTFIICLLPFIISLFGSIKGQQPQTCLGFCPETVNDGGWVSFLREGINGTTVMLIWLPNTGAGGTQYVIQFREANIADTASFNTSAPIVNNTNFTLTGLAPVTLYDVRVCLFELPEVCGHCILCVMTDYDPVPPSRPSLTGSPINALSVQLMWERPLGEVDSYTIQYSVVNSSELTDTDFEASASHWIVRGLSPNTSYQFRLVAGNRYGRSLPSLPFFATTPVQSGSPGYLLISTYDDGTFYALTNSDALGSSSVTPRSLEIASSGISLTGIGYYPINSTNGFIYTTHDRVITRHSATLPEPTLSELTLSISASDNVMNRSSSVSLISVDWVNDMLYWLETVNDTYSLIMYSMLDGSEVNCVTNVSTAGGLRVTGIEVDPIHGYLYWSVFGSGGGIFRLDLTLAKSGSCCSSVTHAYCIVVVSNITNIAAMTLNLEDSLLYFANGTTDLSAITLGENLTEHFPHVATRVDIRSIASYNEYLVVTSPSTDGDVLGSFVRIRSSPPGTVRRDIVGILGFELGENATHLYMIREEFQPLPVPPGPVNEVKYFPTVNSINITWTPPQYTDTAFGPSAFSEWIYDLTFQTNSDATVDTEYLYRDLPPNAVYVIDILPSVPGVDDDVDNNTLTSSWIVQTAENVMPIPNIILATNANGSVPIYTVMFNDRQAMQLLEEGGPVFDQPSIGVAYDFYRNTIYWTNSNRIVKSSLSNGETVAIGEPGDGHTSIAVDYIGQRLYWIESNSIYRMLLESSDTLELIKDVDISDLAVDSPSGLLFWTHNEGALRGISAMRLNGLGDRMICVSDSGQLYRYLAITVDTENKRIFWIKEVEGSFQIGVADYGNGSCINVVNKVISDKPSTRSTSDRRVSMVSMVYVAGVLLHTISTSPNTIFITPSNFSSFPSADYQLAIGSYDISIAPDINIRSITANQTSQQFLPDNVGLDVTTVRPTVPTNIRLDKDSSNYILVNITWDMDEGVSPAIVTYEVTYSLSRIDGSIDNGTILKTSDNYFVLEDQLPETTVNVSIRAFTRWYTSDTSPVQTIVSESRIPSQIEQSSASVFEGERGSDELSVLLTWTGLTAEQAGGILINYIISLYSQPSRALLENFIVSPSSTSRLLGPRDLMANQMYSFTVRAENRAGRGNESDDVMFNTNGPQPAMELLAVNSVGMTVIVRENSQPTPMEAIRGPFTVDNRQLIVYYVDSNNLMSINHNIPNSAATIFTPLPMVNDLALDWVGRRLYIALIENNNVSIRVLALDNSITTEELVNRVVLSNAMVKITLSPYTGQLYWIETNRSDTILYRLNLLNNTVTQLYPSNSRKRNVMCSQSGLDTIGELTAALTYDVITDHLWVSTVAGDIWSCDLSGCDCIVRVNGTILLSPGDTLMDIGLPTDSVSLDRVNIYWSGPTGVFYVPRNDVTMLSQLSNLNTSSIVTIDPGQQPLLDEMCLFPALTQAFQPVPMCYNASSDSLTVTWMEPQFTTACENQLYAFPTLSYNITYHIVGFPNMDEEINNIFSRQTPVDGLFSFSNYVVTVSASNIYTRLRSDATPVLNSMTCTTDEGVPSQVRNLTTSANSTTEIYVTWQRPIASGTIENSLSYIISINGTFLELLGNTTTMHLITNLTSSTGYTIQVIANNSRGVSDPVQVDSFTYPFPPVPIIKNVTNTTVEIQLTLLFNHRFLNISVQLIDLMTGEANQSVMLSNNTMYPSVLSLTLNSLLPGTNYNISTSAVYPSGQFILSNASSFRTNDSVPETPEIVLDDFILLWDKPRENGRPITEFTLRAESRDQAPGTLVLNDIDLSMMKFAYNLSTVRIITPGVQTDISLRATNSEGNSNYSNSVTVTIPEPSDPGLPTGVLIGIIVGASVFAFIVLFIIIVLCYCYRLRPKNYDYAFRVEVPYDMELRKLRLNQMRMANNDLYSPNYNPDDVETLKKFPRDRIKLEKLLGRGAFGEVWAGTAVDIMGAGTGPHPVALKTLQKNATEADQRSFLSEAIVMSNFDHPNVLPVLGVCLNNNPFFLILELMEAGDLLAFLRGARQENGPPLLTVEELVKIALDVANGARYLETQHFVHRDLAARNCLVSSKGPDRVVKIGDFGLARDVYHSDYYRKEGQGLLPVRWMAPESLLDGKFTVDSDIWSYGILLWEITTLGRQPYPARSNQEVFQFVIGGGRCEKPDNCHPKLYRLMRQCWQHRPEERPRFTVIVDTLTRLHERLVEGNESSSSEESEFEDEEPRYTIQPRGSGGRRSLRSSIRSGASNIVTGIVNLTRAGSMRMRNSIRRQGSLRRQDEINEARAASSINRGRCVSSSEQQLLEPSSGLDHLIDDSAGEDQSMNSHTVRTAPHPHHHCHQLCNHARAQSNTIGHNNCFLKCYLVLTRSAKINYVNAEILSHV